REFLSVFRAQSRKFKILAIPDVLAHGKSYAHDFAKKSQWSYICRKSCVESSFDRFFKHCLGNTKPYDRFFMHCLENLKYWPFPTY
ncbi:hypothetical protein BHE74_00051352, partial [Ensete ventricosum]